MRRTALAVALLVATSAGAADRALESAVKSAFLHKFAAFVEWPAGTFPSASAPFELCVIGTDPYGGRIHEAGAGQSVGSHPLVVRQLPRAERGARCHAMFVSGSSSQSVEEALREVAGVPVLTVTDSDLGPDAGIVHFVIVNDRVSFDIDAIAAQQNGLTISSKLLALARNVRTGRRGGRR